MAAGSFEKTVAYLTMGCLCCVVAVVAFLEYLVGATAIPVVRWLALGSCALSGMVGWKLSRQRRVAVATVAALLAVAILSLVALTPRKPFRTFYARLEPGMSEAAVLESLDRSFPAGGRFAVPETHRSGDAVRGALAFTLDRSDGRYNSEVILARFENGRLRSAEYHPD